MDAMNNPYQPARPRRRRKTRMQIFKETQLPLIIAGLAVVTILIFIIGAAVRSGTNDADGHANKNSAAQKAEEQKLEAEQADVLARSEEAARMYDYTKAINILDSFSGDLDDYPDIRTKRTEYVKTRDALVPWEDPSKIPNLSLQMLIADPQTAFKDAKYSTQFKQNFLTITEFSAILEQLYANGYVLVSLNDIYNVESITDGGYTYAAKTIALPEGKKPLILTQTNVNYHTYLTDGDGDKLPDKDGRGFANKLLLDAKGNFVNEFIGSDGQVHIGAYDMIPLLENFIAQHPDFSYQGARAVIAITGYDGLFGYRTNPQAERTFGTAVYNQELESAKTIAQKLQETGYELACYTYENIAYGQMSAKQVEVEMEKWTSEVASIIPGINIFVFAKNSDIASENSSYNDDRFSLLSNAGFQIYLGFSESGRTWSSITDEYIRQGRILLSPANISSHSDWFADFFETTQILDSNR